MKRFTRIFLKFLMLVLLVPHAEIPAQIAIPVAQESGASESLPSNVLGLNDAVLKAIQRSPALEKLNWERESIKGQQFQNSRLKNPSAGLMGNEIFNDGEAGQFGIFVQKNIVRNNRVGQVVSAYDWKLKSLQHRVAFQQRKTAQAVGLVFVEIGYFDQLYQLQSNKLAEYKKLQVITNSLVKTGDLPPIAGTRFQLEIEQLQRQLLVYQGSIARQKARLASFTGLENPEIDFSFDEERKHLKEHIKAEVDYSKHPQVQVYDDLVQFRRWMTEVARSGQMPDLQLQTSVNYDSATDDFFGGFQLTVPRMVNDRKTGAIRTAQAEVQMTLAAKQQTLFQLQRSTADLIAQLKNDRTLIQAYENDAIPAADRNLIETQRFYSAKESTVEQLKEATEISFSVRKELLDVARSLMVNHVRLETIWVDEN